MKLNRRRFMLLSSSVAASTAMPLKAGVLSSFTTNNIVLTTGLHTDDAFAQGVNANLQMVTLTSTSDYATLLTKLTNTENQHLFALVQPAEAILLEQALRDSNKRNFISYSLKAPKGADKSWAFTLGDQLAKGKLNVSSQSQHGLPLVAITAYL